MAENMLSHVNNIFALLRTKAFRWVYIVASALILIAVLRMFTGGSQDTPDVYRIARDRNWTGLNLLGAENHLCAFTDELLIAVAKQQGFHLELVNVSPKTMLEGLQEDNYDAVISTLIPDQQLRKKYDFSYPYFYLSPVVVVQKNSTINSLNDLNGKSVGIQRNSSLMVNNAFVKHVKVFPFDTPSLALDDLVRDRYDGIIMDLFSSYAFSNGVYKEKIRIIPTTLTEEGLRIITMKDESSEEFIDLINHGIEEAKINGTYQRLLDKWDLGNLNQ